MTEPSGTAAAMVIHRGCRGAEERKKVQDANIEAQQMLVDDQQKDHVVGALKAMIRHIYKDHDTWEEERVTLLVPNKGAL